MLRFHDPEIQQAQRPGSLRAVTRETGGGVEGISRGYERIEMMAERNKPNKTLEIEITWPGVVTLTWHTKRGFREAVYDFGHMPRPAFKRVLRWLMVHDWQAREVLIGTYGGYSEVDQLRQIDHDPVGEWSHPTKCQLVKWMISLR